MPPPNPFKIQSILALKIVLSSCRYYKLYLSHNYLSLLWKNSELGMYFWSDENPSREPIFYHCALQCKMNVRRFTGGGESTVSDVRSI